MMIEYSTVSIVRYPFFNEYRNMRQDDANASGISIGNFHVGNRFHGNPNL